MSSISFGFLVIPLQALDMVGPMDILQNVTQYIFDEWHGADKGKALKAPNITFHHIGPSLRPVQTTGNLHIAPTTTLADCPPLDYLLVGGTAPTYAANLPSDIKAFIQAQAKTCKAIFTTCTGGIVIGAAGVLDGLEATTNHVLLDAAKGIARNVKWTDTKNWVVAEKDGVKFWTGAGAGAGMDMISQWIREDFEHGQELLDYSTMALEWQPRDISGKPMGYLNGRNEQVKV